MKSTEESVQSTPTVVGRRLHINWRQTLADWWIFIIFLLLLAIFSLVAPGFLSQQNFKSTTLFASDTLLLAAAETFVIITGGIDLSVGAVLGLTGMISADVMQFLLGRNYDPTLTIALGFVSALLSGALLGAVNGFVITSMKITPFIATLGMLGIATGFTFLITNGVDVTNVPASIGNIGNNAVFDWFPIPFLISLVVVLVAYYVLKRTRFGLYTYAIGSNAEGSRVSGVKVSRHLFWIYVLSGAIAGLAGVLVVARLIDGSPLEGANDELNAIAAVVIGGASLFGGTGNILRTVIGGLIISVLVTGLVIAGVQPYWQTVSVGVIIILAVFIDQSQQNQEG